MKTTRYSLRLGRAETMAYMNVANKRNSLSARVRSSRNQLQGAYRIGDKNKFYGTCCDIATCMAVCSIFVSSRMILCHEIVLVGERGEIKP